MPDPTVGLVLGTGRSGMGMALATALGAWASGELLELPDAFGVGTATAADADAAGAFSAGLGSSHESTSSAGRTRSRVFARTMALRLAQMRPDSALPRAFGRATTVALVLTALPLAPGVSGAATQDIGVHGPIAKRQAGEGKAPELLTTVQCDRTSEPGRVRCGVEAKPRAGATLTWADVVVVDVPPFATALRGRVGPDEATAKEPAGYRFALALVAKSTGKGTLHLRIRAVVCTEADGCHSVTSEASTEVVVGSG